MLLNRPQLQLSMETSWGVRWHQGTKTWYVHTLGASKKQHCCFQHGNFLVKFGGAQKSWSFFLTKVIHICVVEIQTFQQGPPFKTIFKENIQKYVGFCDVWELSKNSQVVRFLNVYKTFVIRYKTSLEKGVLGQASNLKKRVITDSYWGQKCQN